MNKRPQFDVNQDIEYGTNQDVSYKDVHDSFDEFSQNVLMDDVQHEIAEVVRNQSVGKKKRR